MLKEKNYIFKKLNILSDIFLIAITFYIAHLVRNEIVSTYIAPFFVPYRSFSNYSFFLLVFLPVLILCFEFNHYYFSQRMRSTLAVTKIILVSITEAALITISIVFFINKAAINRPQLAIFIPLLLIVMTVKSIFIKRLLITLREKGYNYRTLLLVGSGEKLQDFIKTLDKHPFWGFKVMGIITDAEKVDVGSTQFGYKVVGRLPDTVPYLFNNPIDSVIFIPVHTRLEELKPVLEECEEMGIKTTIALNFFEFTIAHPETDKFEDIPVLTYNPTREINPALFFKYMFDRVVAFSLLLLFSPLMIVVAILIKIMPGSRGGPVLYTQTRCGLYGRTFTLYKFRSMIPDAEQKLDELLLKNEMEGPVFKIKNDPRVTSIGRFIRKTSIDELPQLLNVLRGEMSLVGPRPPIPAEVLKYDRWQRRRLSMKPGITCLWQVMGRNKLPFETWMKLDLEYIDNWSLKLDFKILFKTIYVVTTGYGAM